MNYFRINNELSAVCEWKKTRSAFKHEAVLKRNGYIVDKKKICYLNRTWERYEFESVLYKLAESAELTSEEKELFNEKIKNEFREEDEKELAKKFGTIGAIAKMGELFSDSKAKANDWKARMIKAGLNLEMPEDWEELSEEEKESRLNKVINQLTK